MCLRKPEKCVSRFLKWVDLFGRKTDLRMTSRSKFKTRIGGVFTLMLFSLCLLLFFNFANDMFEHRNPNVIYSQYYSASPGKTYFSREAYFFMFGLQDKNTFAHFINESLYTVKVTHEKLGKDGDSSFAREAEIAPCSAEDLPQNPKMNHYFTTASGSPIENLYCVKNLADYYMQGSFDSDVFVYLRIRISKCMNSSACADEETIKGSLQGAFAIYTMDFLIDPQEYEEPGMVMGRDYYTPISVGTKTKTNRFISSSTVSTDDGLIFSSRSMTSYPTYSYDKENTVIDSANDGLLIDFLWRKDSVEREYQRGYKKVQNILAEMGGFMQFLYLFFLLIGRPVITKLYFEKIVNKVYNFERDVSAMVNSKALVQQDEKRQTLRNSIWGIETNTSSQVVKKSVVLSFFGRRKPEQRYKKDELVKEILRMGDKPPLRLSFCEYLRDSIFRLFWEPSSKFRRLNLAKGAVKQTLDVSYLLKKLYEIDKLKMILFDESQFHLFEHLTKPTFKRSLKMDFGGNRLSNVNGSEEEAIGKCKRLCEAYTKIQRKVQKSSIDRKLVELLDENVREILNTNNSISIENNVRSEGNI